LNYQKNFESVIEVINGIVAYEANELYGQYHDPIASSRIGKEIIQLIKYGETIKTSKYNSYKLIRNNYFNFLQEIMFGCDAIISPSSTGEAPFSLNDTGDACFSALWTLVGLPEITIPSGFGDNRLPLGIQLIGKYKNDYELLIIADLLSSILGNIGFPPEPEMLLIES
jgi:Asp-tRNAAsn/Glu-tRNAGln amidotransferase A subunit and related amidases